MESLYRDPAEDRPETFDLESRDVWVVGCGNVLMGDDGIGPAFIKHLMERGGLPDGAGVLDAGTGIRKVLFNLVLAEKKPKRIVIVDAVDMGRRPGEVFEIDLEAIPAQKADDFSMHQLPTSNMLRELRDNCGVDVRVIAVQVTGIPDRVTGGLSDAAAGALEEVRRRVLECLRKPAGAGSL